MGIPGSRYLPIYPDVSPLANVEQNCIMDLMHGDAYREISQVASHHIPLQLGGDWMPTGGAAMASRPRLVPRNG